MPPVCSQLILAVPCATWIVLLAVCRWETGVEAVMLGFPAAIAGLLIVKLHDLGCWLYALRCRASQRAKPAGRRATLDDFLADAAALSTDPGVLGGDRATAAFIVRPR